MKHTEIVKFLSLVALLATHLGYAQTTLSGRIIYVDGTPLSGVNITVENTENGTSTDARCHFELSDLSGQITLLISSVGYESQQVEINLNDDISKLKIRMDTETFKLEEVIVVANKSLIKNSVTEARERLDRIPGGTNLVSMDRLDDQRSLTLNGALQFQPGVIIQEFFGANDQPRLNIRGSGIQSNPQRRGVNLLQDGISTNFSDRSYIIGIPEPRAANYIEVFRGANGLKYGATTLGAAINLVSKNGYKVSPLELKAEGGSFGYYNGSIATGGIFGQNDIYTAVSYNQADGFREFNSSSRLNAMVNIGRKLNDHLETRLYATYTDLSFDIPGPLTQAQLDENSKQINPGVNPPVSIGPNVVRDRPCRDSKILRIANKSIYNINDRSDLTLGLYYQYGDDTFDFPITVDVRNSISNNFGLTASYLATSKQNIFRTGIIAKAGTIDRSYSVILSGEVGAKYAENELTATNLIFYAEDIYQFTDKLSGLLSVQISSNTRNNEDVFATPSSRPFFDFTTQSSGTFDAGDTSLDLDFFGFNPRLGLMYDLGENHRLFLNVSRSYESPTFDELINIAEAIRTKARKFLAL